MALKGTQSILVIFFFMSSLFAVTTAQSSSSCQSALLSLSPCLNFISGKATTPSSSCCTQLSSVVNSEPQCLCALLSGDVGSGLGISINKTQALELPTVCKVQTASISQCNTSSSPPSTGSPSTPNNPSGGGSKNVPSVDTGSANGSPAEVSITLVISLMFMAVFSSASSITV
ncbi:non-specific lipid transfer protein GPI-anchored 2-like isoform X2 [Dendrobium catenatum]|uniref:non-specific lipid transfer protein GPI-anchored 2-like isoform X2 n=1 Tax=Dendrobium catenatum TaxID=906689 RepID=UPI0010A014C8|nr:non-specific lipid transfer protein GPI-anchored 2-like isoform X2 [Dendrobium catenatum]